MNIINAVAHALFEGIALAQRRSSMYALVEISSKQYKVRQGDVILVDLLGKKAGDSVSFDSVLAIVDGDNATFGTPYVKNAQIKGEVVTEKVLADKIKVYKYHRRKGYRKTQGHRQGYSQIKIDEIVG